MTRPYNIYLDNNATTPMLSEVIELEKSMDSFIANPNSMHTPGREARKLVYKAEKEILDCINGHHGRLVWTSGGSEANQLIPFPGYEKLTSSIEHKSNTNAWIGIKPDKDGVLTCDEITAGVRDLNFNDELGIVSVQLVNSETGVISEVEEYSRLSRKHLLHSDCVQALGKIPIDLEKFNADMITLSAHKVGGPKGIGCLWIKNELYKTLPLDTRTINPKQLKLFARATQLSEYKRRYKDYSELYEAFRRTFLATTISFEVLPVINGSRERKTSSTISLTIPGVSNLDLMMELDGLGIYISTGSACDSKSLLPSKTLLEMGLTKEEALSTIRISFGIQNTIEEAQIAGKVIAETANRLLKLQE